MKEILEEAVLLEESLEEEALEEEDLGEELSVVVDGGRRIRRYQQEDNEKLLELIRELQALECELYDRMKDPSTIDQAYLDSLHNDCEECCGSILVVEDTDGSTLLGYAVVLTKIASETQKDADYEVPYVFGEVVELSVTRSSRGSGLGRHLMGACEELVAKAGVQYLRVSVLACNRTAHRFYERSGLRDHLITMEKKLDISEEL